jgi:hypothetical protein
MANTFTPINEKANVWLNDYLRPHMRIFEYGSSDSTLFLGDRVQLIVSVEHSINKFNHIQGPMQSIRNNFVYRHIPPEDDPKPFPYSHLSYGSTHKDYLYYNFKKYVNYITEYEDNFFHVVIINGFSRASCIMATTGKMKTNGIIILNNSERYVYQDAIKLFLNKYKVTHFDSREKRTSIYEYNQTM